MFYKYVDVKYKYDNRILTSMNLTSAAVATIIQFAESEAIINRAMETLACMDVTVSGQDLGVISHADLLALRQSIRGSSGDLGQLLVNAQLDESHAGNVRNVLLTGLHKATVQALGVARVAWGEDTERNEVVAPLRASAQQGVEILGEAEDWEAAWGEVEPGFVPVTGLTLASFQAQIAAARAAWSEERRMTVRRQRAGARLALALARLNNLSQRWYAVATATFGPETPEGQGIRKGITTTYVPRYHEAAKRRRAERKAAKTPAAVG